MHARNLAALLLLTASASCVATARQEPWAPVELRLDQDAIHPSTEAFVYVDDEYRGNFVDGRFRVFLTLQPHLVRVHLPGGEPWERSVTLTRAEYPAGRVVVVSPAEVATGG